MLPLLLCLSLFFVLFFLFFFNDTATTEIYTLSLHDALPISAHGGGPRARHPRPGRAGGEPRSEEHTSELQSPKDIVCRLLLEKKKKKRPVSESTAEGRTGLTHGETTKDN